MKIAIMKRLQLLISLLVIFPVATLANEPTLVALKPKYLRDDLDTFLLGIRHGENVRSATGYIDLGSSATFKLTYTDRLITSDSGANNKLRESHIRIDGTFTNLSGTEFKNGLYYYPKTGAFWTSSPNLDIMDITRIGDDTELIFQCVKSTEGRVPPYTVIEYFDWTTIQRKIELVAQQGPQSNPVASDSSIPCDSSRFVPLMVSIDGKQYNLDSSFTGIYPVRYLTGRISKSGKIRIEGADTSKKLQCKGPGFSAQIQDILFIRVQALGVCQEDPGTASPYMSWWGLQERKNKVYSLEKLPEIRADQAKGEGLKEK